MAKSSSQLSSSLSSQPLISWSGIKLEHKGTTYQQPREPRNRPQTVSTLSARMVPLQVRLCSLARVLAQQIWPFVVHDYASHLAPIP